MIDVLSPVPGQALPLAAVPDPVFAAALVGPGVAVDPERGPVDAVAPIGGRLVKLHPHAYVIANEDGAGVLVHLGIDTVQLEGEGFQLHVKEGDSVDAGQLVVSFDAGAIEAGGRSPICPVVALDAAADALVDVRTAGAVTTGDTLFGWTR